MTFQLTLAAFAFAAIALWRSYKRTAAASFLVAVVLAFGVGAGPIAGVLLRNIQSGYTDHGVPSKWPPKAAIVLLGMGTTNTGPGQEEVGPLAYGRVVQAIEAYTSCKRGGGVCTIIMTGGDKAHQGVTEAAVYGEQLVALGVHPNDLVLESRSQSTWENARFTRPIIDRLAPDQVFLVTSGVHMRRALIYFDHFGVKATPIRSDYLLPLPTYKPMAFNFAITDLALSEYQGLARFWLYNTMGWND